MDTVLFHRNSTALPTGMHAYRNDKTQRGKMGAVPAKSSSEGLRFGVDEESADPPFCIRRVEGRAELRAGWKMAALPYGSRVERLFRFNRF